MLLIPADEVHLTWRDIVKKNTWKRKRNTVKRDIQAIGKCTALLVLHKALIHNYSHISIHMKVTAAWWFTPASVLTVRLNNCICFYSDVSTENYNEFGQNMLLLQRYFNVFTLHDNYNSRHVWNLWYPKIMDWNLVKDFMYSFPLLPKKLLRIKKFRCSIIEVVTVFMWIFGYPLTLSFS